MREVSGHSGKVPPPHWGHHLLEHALHPPQVSDLRSHVLKVGCGDNARFWAWSIAPVGRQRDYSFTPTDAACWLLAPPSVARERLGHRVINIAVSPRKTHTPSHRRCRGPASSSRRVGIYRAFRGWSGREDDGSADVAASCLSECLGGVAFLTQNGHLGTQLNRSPP
jgi:hypothetical protein